jgi:hypothetical protein
MTNPHVEHVMDVITARGVPFRVVYSDRLDTSGKSIHHTYVVSFYDRRYDHTPHGQFVADHLVDTVLKLGQNGDGVSLYGDVPDWVFDSTAMRLVYSWLMQTLYTIHTL